MYIEAREAFYRGSCAVSCPLRWRSTGFGISRKNSVSAGSVVRGVGVEDELHIIFDMIFIDNYKTDALACGPAEIRLLEGYTSPNGVIPIAQYQIMYPNQPDQNHFVCYHLCPPYERNLFSIAPLLTKLAHLCMLFDLPYITRKSTSYNIQSAIK